MGVLLTLGSTLHRDVVTRVRPSIMGCERGCDVVARGWPAAFVVDGATTSPVGSADLVGVLVGVDDLDAGAFAKTALFWSLASALAARFLRRARSVPGR